MSECSPIAIFAYNRPRHLNRLFDSLYGNELFSDSPIFVFCDGSRGQPDREAVAQTRRVARDRLDGRGELIESDGNKGLALSVISGVSQVCGRFGSVIVLEDDLVVHPHCLNFLNAALRHYADAPKIYHVNAYRYPQPRTSAPYFSRLISSWGWGTWQRAWINFEADASSLERDIRAADLESKMDFDGAYPYYKMLKHQTQGRVDSWAIRWYASTLLRGALAVCPNISLVNNFGFDNSGVHCGSGSTYNVEVGAASEDWPSQISEDEINYRQMQRFFRGARGTLAGRVLQRLKRRLTKNQRGGAFEGGQ